MPLPPAADRRHQPRIEFELAGARLEIERTPPRGTPRAVSLPRDAATETIAHALNIELGAPLDEAAEVAAEIRRRLGL